MISVYIGNDKVKIVDAVVGKKVTVKNFYAITAPNDYIDKPDSKMFKELSQVIKDALQEMQPKGKKFRVVLDSSTIPYREMILQPLSPTKLRTLVKNEIFTDEKLAESNTVDFVEADKKVDDQKRSKYFITYVSNQIIEDIENLIIKDMNCKLLSVDIAQNAITKLIGRMKNLPDQFILVDYKGASVTIYLFVYGKHVYSMFKPVISEPNPKFQNERIYFINEMSGILLDTTNFFKSRYEGVEFKNVFITGDVDRFEVCSPQIESKINMDIRNLPKCTCVEDVDEVEFNQFSDAIGGFFREA